MPDSSDSHLSPFLKWFCLKRFFWCILLDLSINLASLKTYIWWMSILKFRQLEKRYVSLFSYQFGVNSFPSSQQQRDKWAGPICFLSPSPPPSLPRFSFAPPSPGSPGFTVPYSFYTLASGEVGDSFSFHFPKLSHKVTLPALLPTSPHEAPPTPHDFPLMRFPLWGNIMVLFSVPKHIPLVL